MFFLSSRQNVNWNAKIIYFQKYYFSGNTVFRFYYWDYLTNFWHNNWQSIIDIVGRLCQIKDFFFQKNTITTTYVENSGFVKTCDEYVLIRPERVRAGAPHPGLPNERASYQKKKELERMVQLYCKQFNLGTILIKTY